MEFFHEAWTFLTELLIDTEATLDYLVTQYGTWVYAILFVIIFCETGLVVTPFLPGDSLLFLAGTIAHRPANDLNILVLIIIAIAAAILGDAANYAVGRLFGEKLFRNPDSRIFRRSYLEKTNRFYEKHGGKTIVLARFVPIVRTFAPFVAGMGKMTYRRFFSFNVIGGVAWIVIFSMLGYLVGGVPFVQNNIKLMAVLIIAISLMPMVYEIVKAGAASRKATEE